MPKHRAHGEGSLFRRKSDGRFVAYVPLPNGKRRFVSARTRTECAARWKALKEQVANPTAPAPSSQPLGEFLAAWLEDSIRPNKAYRTYHIYESICRLHVCPVLGRILLADLTPQHVQAMMAGLTRKDLAASTRRQIRTVLSIALRRAEKWLLVDRNVAALTDMPEKPRQARSSLPLEFLPRFLTAADHHPLGALFVLALSSGLRRGELLGLQWRHVDLDGGTLNVVQQMQRQDGKSLLVEVKRESSLRIVYLPSVAVDALRRHQARQLEVRLVTVRGWQDNDLVFCRADGSALTNESVRHACLRVSDLAGVPHVTMHDLRRSYARFLISQGADPRTAAELLGHASTAITTNVYDESTTERKRIAADALGRLFSGQ